MKEYGGYIELEHYKGLMLHEAALALNCGRNCLAYLLRAKKIQKIVLPLFICDSVTNLCKKEQVNFRFYGIRTDFTPEDIELAEDEWMYIVNYYGQLTEMQLKSLHKKYVRVIVDNAQAYFDEPLLGVDTLYTCRKYFGVADGAFLYTDTKSDVELPQDESFERMRYLLGRFERSASEFYMEYTANNRLFAEEPIKRMSRLTENLLHGIDYESCKKHRTNNFRMYHELLGAENKLHLRCPDGAYAYPLMLVNGVEIRRALQKKKIYIPILWPSVFDLCSADSLEYRMAQQILPLPCDQRYGYEDIRTISEAVRQFC